MPGDVCSQNQETILLECIQEHDRLSELRKLVGAMVLRRGILGDISFPFEKIVTGRQGLVIIPSSARKNGIGSRHDETEDFQLSQMAATEETY